MLDHSAQTAAYNRLPCPSNLPEEERIPYQMLCLFYRHYREGILPRDTAQVFKTLVCDWEQVPNMEKAALLRYAIANEFEQARQTGTGGDWDGVWALLMAYMALPIARGEWDT